MLIFWNNSNVDTTAASQVAARPVTVYILSTENVPKANNVPAMAHMRWGLAAANAGVPTPEAKVGISMIDPTEEFWNRNGKSPARTLKRNMRAKAITMANWVREKVGLPLIQMPEVGRIHGVVKPGFVTILESSHQPHQEPDIHVSSVQGGHHVQHEGKWTPHAHHRHGWRATSFSGRLNKALMTLGPWEGRAVAFVLGKSIHSSPESCRQLTDDAIRLRSRFPVEDALCPDCSHVPLFPSEGGGFGSYRN